MAAMKRNHRILRGIFLIALAAGALAIGWFFGIGRAREALAAGQGGRDLYGGVFLAGLMAVGAVLLVVDAIRKPRRRRRGDDGSDAAFIGILSAGDGGHDGGGDHGGHHD